MTLCSDPAAASIAAVRCSAYHRPSGAWPTFKGACRDDRASRRPRTAHATPDIASASRRRTLPVLHVAYGDADTMRFWDSLPSRDVAETAARIRQSLEANPQWHAALRGAAARDRTVRRHGELPSAPAMEPAPGARVDSGAAVAGPGFRREATGALLEHCFTTLGTHRVEAHIEPGNTASIRLADRLGFRQEGLMRDWLFVAGQPRDMLLYALLRPDWSPTAMSEPTMRAMLMDAAHRPLRLTAVAIPDARRRTGADPRARLRRMPHRPARGGRRTDRAEAAADPRPRDRRHGRRARRRRGPFRPWRSRRRALARLHLRRLRILPRRPREPVRAGAFHRLPDRWRLRRIHRRRPALLLRHAGRLQRRAGRAAAVRRPDRLPRAAHGGRWRAARALRLRRRRAYHCAGGALAGTPRVRLHQPGRHRRAGVRARTRRGVGRRLRPAAARIARCRHHLCPGRPAGAGRVARGGARRHRGLRRHPHEPDSRASPTTSCGASASCARSPI